jgi:plastocyanin
MLKRLAATAALATALALVAAPTAPARERLLTLYSPKINTQPYVHDTHHVTLRPNGRQAPRRPGYITGWAAQDIVDSKRRNAKPLPLRRMMVHHFLIFAPGRVDDAPGSCWGRSGFIGGRGEEHPSGKLSRVGVPRSFRRRYGVNNRTGDGSAPTWRLTAMVMNHYKRPKSFYVRLRVWYVTGERRKSTMPTVVGKCSHLLNGMSYDVPGGGRRGSNFVDRSRWTSPINARIISATSHNHGGAKYQSLTSVTCRRRLFKAPAYYGRPSHIYNRIRPILHEPGPIGNGAYATQRGIPLAKGEVLQRRAVHDNSNLHVASMGFWVLNLVRDDSVKPCGRIPRDIREVNKPKRYDKTPNFGLVVPQLAKPTGVFQPFTGSPVSVGDLFFRPGKISANVGQTVSWRFTGSQPHSVTVANGPRGFSSVYLGRTRGRYSFRPTVPGTYRMTCLIHPTTMAQTLVVRR